MYIGNRSEVKIMPWPSLEVHIPVTFLLEYQAQRVCGGQGNSKEWHL